MPGADRDGLTAGPADRLQAVGGAIVALDSGLGHMSEILDHKVELYAKIEATNTENSDPFALLHVKSNHG